MVSKIFYLYPENWGNDLSWLYLTSVFWKWIDSTTLISQFFRIPSWSNQDDSRFMSCQGFARCSIVLVWCWGLRLFDYLVKRISFSNCDSWFWEFWCTKRYNGMGGSFFSWFICLICTELYPDIQLALTMGQAQYCSFRMTWPAETGYPMQLSKRAWNLICWFVMSAHSGFTVTWVMQKGSLVV